MTEKDSVLFIIGINPFMNMSVGMTGRTFYRSNLPARIDRYGLFRIETQLLPCSVLALFGKEVTHDVISVLIRG